MFGARVQTTFSFNFFLQTFHEMVALKVQGWHLEEQNPYPYLPL